jgi:RNA polymerase sigma factor (TIGR02999 family)
MTATSHTITLSRAVKSARPSTGLSGSDRAPESGKAGPSARAGNSTLGPGPHRSQGTLNDVTCTQEAIESGDTLAASALLPLVYDELRKLAARVLAQERPGQTLDPTGLVHEAYLRLLQSPSSGASSTDTPGWANRRHFFAAAAEAMRRILVENARRKGRKKHGGGLKRENAELDAMSADGYPADILALHDALEQFSERDPQKAKLVELRFFAGLTLEQAAACLGISLSTADRAWKYSRAWLYAAMAGEEGER